jgi:hypothetical protein
VLVRLFFIILVFVVYLLLFDALFAALGK